MSVLWCKLLKSFVGVFLIEIVYARSVLFVRCVARRYWGLGAFTFWREGILYARPGWLLSVYNNNPTDQGPSASRQCESGVILLQMS